MRQRLWTRAGSAAILAAACVAGTAGQARSQQAGGDPPPAKRDLPLARSRPGADRAERASGVVVKVEKVTRGASEGSTIDQRARAGKEVPVTYRLTINTNAVWRDWARDQARTTDSGPPRKDAKKGDESVATRGEPAEGNALVQVDVGPATHVETRFRAPDDETGKGEKKPEGVESSQPAGLKRAEAAKPVQFHPRDLAVGLFVEADFRHVPAQNPASRVTVIRPIQPTDGAETPRSR